MIANVIVPMRYDFGSNGLVCVEFVCLGKEYFAKEVVLVVSVFCSDELKFCAK